MMKVSQNVLFTLSVCEKICTQYALKLNIIQESVLNSFMGICYIGKLRKIAFNFCSLCLLL